LGWVVNDAFTQLPFGAVHLQAFCRKCHAELKYLGRFGSQLKVAATDAGQKVLAAKYTIQPTGEMDGERIVVTVRAQTPTKQHDTLKGKDP
jgi:hypothetical protein